MIQIHPDKCIGCGKCVKDCFPGEIELIDHKAAPKGKYCMECGHCVAVCPVNAVELLRYDMSEVVELRDLDDQLDPTVYLNHLKARRSIRSFQKTPVSREDIQMILEAGRFSPTGGNLQNVSYYVSREDLAHLKDMTMSELRRMGDEVRRSGVTGARYPELWIEMDEAFRRDGTDKLFFNTDTVIVISSDSPQSACIAAAHMETMVYSLGLGMLYSGFTARAIAHSQMLREYLKIKEEYQAYAVLVIGHPAVEYVRTVPRKPADVIWN